MDKVKQPTSVEIRDAEDLLQDDRKSLPDAISLYRKCANRPDPHAWSLGDAIISELESQAKPGDELVKAVEKFIEQDVLDNPRSHDNISGPRCEHPLCAALSKHKAMRESK